MQWRPIRAAFASSRQKRASSFRLKRSTFWPAKAARPNSWPRTRRVPVLELDDGSFLSEPVAICRYLEGLHPEPNLLGRDLREHVDIERWNRRMEFELFAPIGRTFQNSNPIFQGRFKQFPEYGEAQRTVVYQRLERLDRELKGHRFIAGDRFTIADITALVAIDISGRLAEIKIAPELAHLTRWHATVSRRPSATA